MSREPSEITGGEEIPWRESSPGERRMALSRAEIERIFAPGPDEFPRSRTMKYLVGGKGRMIALGAFAGLMAVKPRYAMTLVRFLPLGKLMPIVRLIKTLR